MRNHISFTPFEAEVTRVLNNAPSQLVPNIWGFVSEFDIVCWGLEVPPTIGMFFRFYVTKPSKGCWVTLGGLLTLQSL